MLKFTEFLKELAKPQNLQKAKDTLASYNKVDARDNSWQYKISDYFEKEGFSPLGSGKYSVVFSHPKFNYIVKVFMKDAAFLKWYKFSMENKDNPYVPQFRGKIIKLTNNFFVTRMEKLTPYRGYFSMNELEKDEPNAKAVYDFLIQHKSLLDLHGENVMMRGKQLVIIDPFYNWFKPEKGGYTIDPEDFDLSKV